MPSTPEGQNAASVYTGDAGMVREVFEAMPVMMLGLRGPEFEVVAVNGAYRGWHQRHRMLGLTMAELYPDRAGQQVIEMLQQAYESQEPQSRREWRVQFAPEGSAEAAGERFADFTITPWRGDDGSLVGVLAHVTDATERVTARRAAERRLAEVERRYADARDGITTLQRELLPHGLPVLPSARTAASYLLADTEDAAGGDWFDAVPLSGGRLGLVVGDVVGHGLTASATMGHLRVVLEDRLLDGSDLGTALAAADRVAERRTPARAATVCAVVVDLATGDLSYCTAGHPPPLIIGPDGSTRYLPATGSGPLGTSAAFTLKAGHLADGETILLYTDGILERPGRDHATSTVELARTAADAVSDRILDDTALSTVERITQQPVEILVRATGHSDDLTLLATQRVVPPTPFRWEATADGEAIRAGYTALGDWLGTLGTGTDDVRALQLAACELITNAVQHAYPDLPAPGPVRLAADLLPEGILVLEVRDAGRWQEHPPGLSGRTGGLGLVVTEAMVDNLHLTSDENGTRATVRHRLSTPARLLITEPTSAPAPEPEPQLLLILEQPDGPGPRIRLDGPITALTVDHLRAELQRRTGNGTHALTVDLTGVTMLTSAGVAALNHATARSDEHDRPLRLYAPVGSPADQVLTLVAMPHATTDPNE
jgi:PAS domain S-box-containing protein